MKERRRAVLAISAEFLLEWLKALNGKPRQNRFYGMPSDSKLVGITLDNHWGARPGASIIYLVIEAESLPIVDDSLELPIINPTITILRDDPVAF